MREELDIFAGSTIRIDYSDGESEELKVTAAEWYNTNLVSSAVLLKIEGRTYDTVVSRNAIYVIKNITLEEIAGL